MAASNVESNRPNFTPLAIARLRPSPVRRGDGETLASIAKSYGVAISMISRLA